MDKYILKNIALDMSNFKDLKITINYLVGLNRKISHF